MKPAANTPSNTRRSQRSITPRPSSSMAKITPAKGALKAAARPPAAPVAMSSFVLKPRKAKLYLRQKFPQASMTAAPT